MMTIVDRDTFRLPRRRQDAHKGDFGRVYIWGGSVGYTGAPVFAAHGAVGSGAGLVFAGVPANVWSVVASACREAMCHPLPDDLEEQHRRMAACDAALIGPGLGTDPAVWGRVRELVARLNIPLVLDADGLNALAGHLNLLDARPAPTILTPHEGEFARLTGLEVPICDRRQTAADFAQAHNCVLVLKGHRTVTAAPDGRVWLNTGGNPGMATGGSGDVLAGIVLSLIGQGIETAQAAALAVWLHSRAGDLCAAEMGQYATTPTRMLDFLPRALKELE